MICRVPVPLGGSFYFCDGFIERVQGVEDEKQGGVNIDHSILRMTVLHLVLLTSDLQHTVNYFERLQKKCSSNSFFGGVMKRNSSANTEP